MENGQNQVALEQSGSTDANGVGNESGFDNEDLRLLIDLHREGDRQGPGSNAATLKALQMTGLDVSANLQVADLGCGTGASTLTLAQSLPNATLTAVDFCADFLTTLQGRAEADGFAHRISTTSRSMDDLSFLPESLDLIWSEGAIYNIGFEEGLCYWRQFLRDRATIAVSELTWLTASRPAAIDEYWQQEYPRIGTVSEKIHAIEQTGFEPLAFFTLSPRCWLENYYELLEQRFDPFLARHHGGDRAQAIVANEREEIAMYRTYQAYFSYGFYIARKVGN